VCSLVADEKGCGCVGLSSDVPIYLVVRIVRLLTSVAVALSLTVIPKFAC
jgi:hypothetical protein